jgi:hypothetical protein
MQTNVMEEILEDKEQDNLRDHSPRWGERYLPCAHAKGFSSRVEKPDLQSG